MDRVTDIPIQAATLDDVIGIVYVQATTWIRTYPNKEYNITEADVRSIDFKTNISGWQHMIKSPQYGVWVAKRGEEVLGFAAARKDTVPYELYAMYVLPEWQNKGLGTKLTKKTLEWLGNDQPVILHIAVYNQPAILFYKKFGFNFSPPETHGKVSLPSGASIPTIQMHSHGKTTSEVVETGVADQAKRLVKRTKRSYVSRLQLAKLAGLRPSTIKYYTEKGLLPFEQDDTNLRRHYNRSQAQKRLKQIKNLKKQGLTLSEIKQKLQQ